jgi:hypothetical protein
VHGFEEVRRSALQERLAGPGADIRHRAWDRARLATVGVGPPGRETLSASPYWFAPDRWIVLLTVFRKTRVREGAEVERAQQA